MTYTMRTATGRANAGGTGKPNGGYRYSGTKAAKRPSPQEQLRQVGEELRHVASERGYQPASNAVPAPAPIFAENKPATRMNSNGHFEPAPIFDQPAGAHEPHNNSAGVPEPRSIFDDSDNR